MKRWYPALILLCLLLVGCSGKGEKRRSNPDAEAVPVGSAPPPGCMTRVTRWKCSYGDALRAYPLSAPGTWPE